MIGAENESKGINQEEARHLPYGIWGICQLAPKWPICHIRMGRCGL